MKLLRVCFPSVALGIALFGAASLFALPAAAQATLLNGFGGPNGYGTSCEYANDDGSSPAIDITQAFPGGLLFFSQTHTVAYVNNNGNITFNASLSIFTPQRFPVADRPMIAPYWADVDTRGAGCRPGTPDVCANPSSNGVWWHLEPGLMAVTWDRVGYFSCHTDRLMSFQLLLMDASTCGGAQGDFDVEFRYNRCEWTTGDVSGGVTAQAGFDAGDSVHFLLLPPSMMPNVDTLLCTGSNVGSPGIWHFQIRSGAIAADAAACSTPIPPHDAGCLTPECLLIGGRAGPCGCTVLRPVSHESLLRVASALAAALAIVSQRRRNRGRSTA